MQILYVGVCISRLWSRRAWIRVAWLTSRLNRFTLSIFTRKRLRNRRLSELSLLTQNASRLSSTNGILLVSVLFDFVIHLCNRVMSFGTLAWLVTLLHYVLRRNALLAHVKDGQTLPRWPVVSATPASSVDTGIASRSFNTCMGFSEKK